MPKNNKENDLFNRAILEDKLDEYYNSKKDSRVTLFDNGVDVTDQKKQDSIFGDDRPDLLDRNKIGESLYDFDREIDEEDCE